MKSWKEVRNEYSKVVLKGHSGKYAGNIIKDAIGTGDNVMLIGTKESCHEILISETMNSYYLNHVSVLSVHYYEAMLEAIASIHLIHSIDVDLVVISDLYFLCSSFERDPNRYCQQVLVLMQLLDEARLTLEQKLDHNVSVVIVPERFSASANLGQSSSLYRYICRNEGCIVVSDDRQNACYFQKLSAYREASLEKEWISFL